MVITSLERKDLPLQSPEMEADRVARIEREDAVIAKAEADIDAGQGIEDDELEDWLDTLEHNQDTPLCSARRGPPIL